MLGSSAIHGRASQPLLRVCLLSFVPAASFLQAQQAQPNFTATLSASLPESPGAASQEPTSPQARASVSGDVLDVDGAAVQNASVTLENLRTHEKTGVRSAPDGTFSFQFLTGDSFKVTVVAQGFAIWTSTDVATHPGENLLLPPIALEIAPVNTSVDAVFTPYEMAEDEIHIEEKQRVLAIVPNFYVTYNWHAAPLTSGQKYRLAMRNNLDPFTFIGAGFSAAVEQASDTFPGYGQGAPGFARRFGAAYGDEFISTLLGGAVLPSILHQDPRYFYKGTGTVKARALYAISTVFICKGDNGKWQPNYSNALGTLASAAISNAYYPSTDQKGGGIVVTNALIGLGAGAFNGLMQEFVLRRIMFHSAPPALSAPAIPAKQP